MTRSESRISVLFSCVAIVCFVPTEALAAPQDTAVFDFRDTALPDPDPLGSPERLFTATSHGGEPYPTVYELPLELMIRSVSEAPTDDSDLGRLDIDVEIRNTGDEPFHLPVSTDPRRRPLMPGAENRRILQLFGMFSLPAGVPPDDLVSQESGELSFGVRLDGSDSVPESLFELAPDHEVVMRIRVALSVLWRYVDRGLTVVETRVVADEEKLEEDRYRVAARAEIVSANAVTVQLESLDD